MSEKQVSISLDDSRLKPISQALGNKTCIKILEALSEQNLTVTDISKKLKIPLNTTDYNVKKLVKAGLIEKSSHWWSVKGKKMPTYVVSNKKIVFSPKRSNTKTFLWTIGLTGLVGLTIKEFTKVSQPIMEGVPLAMKVEMADTAARTFANTATNTAVTSTSVFGPWTWFVFGAWFAILLFFVLSIANERRKDK